MSCKLNKKNLQFIIKYIITSNLLKFIEIIEIIEIILLSLFIFIFKYK
jgi:hypothetical protein